MLRQSSGNTYSQQVIKDRNSTLLFDLVRRNAPISRAELARASGLSPATVTVLVEELLENHWLRELPTEPVPGLRGRRPIQLEVHAEAGYVAVLEILSHGYRCTLYDICQNKLAQLRDRSCAPMASAVCRELKKLIQPYDSERLMGIHVLYPGLFDEQTGQLGFSAVIASEDMVRGSLLDELKGDFPQSQVMLSNNATAMAYAVFAGHEAETPLLAVSVQEGINAGVVTHDRTCLPVEAGHMILNQDGPLCQCGNRGCLETFCSTPALLSELCRRTDLKPVCSLTLGADCNPQAMAQVAQAFRQGDEAVTRVLEDYAHALCGGIVSMVNLFAVRSVYLGGVIEILGQPFVDLLVGIMEKEHRILTGQQSVTVELFDDDVEASRQAAVMLCTERLFRRN